MKPLFKLHGLIVFLLLLATGCSTPDRPERPDPFIKMSTMQQLMTDLYQLEATQQICERARMENTEAYVRQQWDSLMKKYNIRFDIMSMSKETNGSASRNRRNR